jgi:Domain of unknown function (DUF4181)
MGNNIALLALIIVFTHLILSVLIIGKVKITLPEEGKDINLYGKIVLGIMGVSSFLIILFLFGIQSVQMKWFWIIYIVLVYGFQSFIEWRFLREEKSYIVSLIVMFIGISLSSFLFYN